MEPVFVESPGLYDDVISSTELEYLQSLPGYDASYQIIHFDSWHGWEESNWFALFRKDGKLYEVSGGHYVMASPDDRDEFDPSPIDEDYALLTIIEREKFQAEYE